MELTAVAYADAVRLASAMSEEMKLRYDDDEGASPAHPEDFLPPYGVFMVGAVEGQDVACGGLRLLEPGVGEIKRMYVDPDHRGKGLSRQLLVALLEHARAAGLGEVRLETGTLQPEAIGLYVSEGFLPIAAYGHFADHPQTLCYALVLSVAGND